MYSQLLLKKKRPVFMELLLWLICLVALIIIMKPLLLTGETSLSHDHLYWGMPAYSAFCDAVFSGELPLWNPFSHAGEPLYPALVHLRLLDPITIITTLVGQIFTHDKDLLFSWVHFLQNVVMIWGSYLVMRLFFKRSGVRLFLIPTMLFGAMMFAPLRQASGIYIFVWTPLNLFLLSKIIFFHDNRWRNWILAAVTLGVNWQSYYFAGAWIVLFLFLLSCLLFERKLLSNVLLNKKNIGRILLFSVIVISMMGPNLALMIEKKRFYYPARVVEDNAATQFETNSFKLNKNVELIMPYNVVANAGSFSYLWDLLQTLDPEENSWIFKAKESRRKVWGTPSEAYLYLGHLGWVLALVGLFAGRHRYRKVWLFLCLTLGALMIGPAGGVHRLLYYLFPPFWFIRHLQGFSLSFMFSLLFFIGMGLDYLISSKKEGIVFKEIRYSRLGVWVMQTILTSATIIYALQLKGVWASWLFVLFLLPVGSAFFLRKLLGQLWLGGSLLVAQVLSIIWFQVGVGNFILVLQLLLFVMVPLTLFLKLPNKRFGAHRVVYIGLFLLFVFQLGSLVNHLRHTKDIYAIQEPPQKLLKKRLIGVTPAPLQQRALIPEPINGSSRPRQSIRYLSLLEKRPYVFSVLARRIPVVVGARDVTTSYLNNPKFEKGVSGYHFFQDGNDGKASIVSQKTERGYTLMLAPSSKGNSLLHTKAYNVEKLAGKYVQLSGFIRSDNKTSHAVQIVLNDKVGFHSASTNQWVQNKVIAKIPNDAKYLSINLAVHESATSEAFFDDLKLEVLEEHPNEFKNLRNSLRWNSFYLSRQYFELLHTDLLSEIKEEMFAVSSLPLQFREYAVSLDYSQWDQVFKDLTIEESKSFVRNYLFLDGGESNNILSKEQLLASGRSEAKLEYKLVGPYKHSDFEVEVKMPKDGWLYWASGHDPHWRAIIDGKNESLMRANHNFQALKLNSGTHRIRFIYFPREFVAGVFLFLGVFGLSALFGFLAYSKDLYCDFKRKHLL